MAAPRGVVEIVPVAGAEWNDLAGLLVDLLVRNTERRGGRQRALSTLSFDAGFSTFESGAGGGACTLSFQGSTVYAYPWLKQWPGLRILGDLDALLQLSRVPLCRLQPLWWTKGGRRLGRLLARRELEITGWLGHPEWLRGLFWALSVEERRSVLAWT